MRRVNGFSGWQKRKRWLRNRSGDTPMIDASESNRSLDKAIRRIEKAIGHEIRCIKDRKGNCPVCDKTWTPSEREIAERYQAFLKTLQEPEGIR